MNPDTFEILEMDLPEKLSLGDEEIYGVHLEFVRECYPNGEMNENISEQDRHRIKSILKDVAYTRFIEKQRQETQEA